MALDDHDQWFLIIFMFHVPNVVFDATFEAT